MKRKIAIQTQTLNKLALVQLITGAVVALLAGSGWGLQLAASIAIGAAIMLFSLLLLGWSWQRLNAKKSIAWTAVIIVIKYAVSLGSIFYLVRMEWFSPLGAGLGIASFMLAALIFALLEKNL